MKKAVFPVTTAFLFTAARLISADLPSGGQVAAGSAAISSASNTLTVTQTSAKAVINWQDFSVGAGHAVRFDQPNASSVTLNRVVGTTASLIDGALSANGRVFLVNPNGVLFGAGAQVEVGGLVASTLALRDADFLAGNYVFDGAGAGIVANHGRIVAVGDGQGGFITMLAAQVVNEGTLQADRGSVALVAADRVTLDLGGLVGVTVERGSLAALVDNGGAIRADGGRVYLTARAADELASAAINHDGVIEARTLVTGEKGEVLLLADMRAGSIAANGGIDVSAPQGGDGGFIETSAAALSFGAGFNVDASASAGRFGRWLLDPAYIDIVATGGLTVPGANAQVSGLAEISVATLSAALNSADVILEASAQIDFKVAFDHAATRNSTLSLLSPTIKLGGDITVTGANRLGLNFGGVSGATTYAGNVFLYNPASGAVVTRTLSTNNGNVLFNGNVGGAQNFSVNAGLGEVRFAATMDGSFAVTQQVYGTLAFSYQAGGNVNSICTIDFVNGTVTFDDNGVIYQVNQFQAVSGYAFNFPNGYLVIPGGTIMDLNAQRVPVTIYDRFGVAYPNPPTTTNSGEMTFATPTEVSKFVFQQTNGSWTDILAQGVSWVTTASASKPANLTITAAKVTIDSGKTLSVDGDIRISTGNFVNNSGSGALTAGTGKTWQVWSSNPAPFDPVTGDVDGDLPYDYKQYGATYGVTTPAGTGSGLFYSFVPQATFSLTGSITKVYDRSTSATNLLSGNYALSGAVDGDILTKAGSFPSAGTYADWNVGTAKGVTATGLSTANFTALSSTGKPVYGYGLSSTSATGNIGAITPKDITAITGITAQDKVYDGSTSATLNTGSATFAGLIAGDTLTVSSATGNFVDKNVGTGKTVNITGLVLGGADLANYNLVSANSTTTAAITKLRLTSLTGITAENKVYDAATGAVINTGSATFGGLVSGDDLSLLGGTGTFADKNVGTAKTVTVAGLTFGGNDAGNYDLPLAAVTTTANITPKDITAITGITAQDKVYDGGTLATLNTGSATFAGLIGGDTLTVSSATGNFVDKNVGTGKTVNITGLVLGGADLANYNLVSANSTTTAAITKLRLTSLTGITAQDKTYDRTTGAAIDTTGASFGGLVSGDSLSLGGGTGTFADWNVGTAKTVTVAGLTLGGTDAGNYDLPLAAVTTTANITPKDITAITGITAQDKVYDGGTLATLNTGSATFAGLIGGDTLTVSSATGNFVDKNVGSGKQVNITGLTLGGADLANYNLVSANSTTTASITKRPITGITGVTANGKVYDANPNATLNTGGAVFGGLIAGDTLTLSGATGLFSDPNAGNGKTVTISGYSLGGTDAGNYEYLPSSFSVLADITRAPLSVRAADLSKNHDGVPFAGGNGLVFTGFVGGQGQGNLTGSPTFGGNSQGAVNGGTYVITPGGFSSANYALNFVNGVLTIGAGSPPPPAVDVRVFLPVAVLVPVLAVPPVAVRLPTTPGGLNYVPASRPAANVVAFAPSPTSANATVSVAAPAGPAAPAAAPAAEATVTEAAPAGPTGSRRAQDGVTRSLMGPLDVIVVNGGVNLGVRPVVAE